MKAVAVQKNLVAKVSGITIECTRGRWNADALRPVVSLAIELFGVDRLMFGSDWPLVDLAGGLDNWLAVARKLVPEAHHFSFFEGTAAATYPRNAADA